MDYHKPFQHTQVNMVGEAMSLALYINMAQAVQVACDHINREVPFGMEEILKVVDTFTAALTWMDMGGIRERYPDLADMPDKVDPLDFKGDEEGLTQWFKEQMEDLKDAERFKVDSLFN